MTIPRAYVPGTSASEMLDGRRRAWKTGENTYRVLGRDGTRYRVEVVGGLPSCSCTAARYGAVCWHATLVMARVEREGRALARSRMAAAAADTEMAPASGPACRRCDEPLRTRGQVALGFCTRRCLDAWNAAATAHHSPERLATERQVVRAYRDLAARTTGGEREVAG